MLVIKDVPEVNNPWKGRDHIEDLGIDERLILKVFLREGDVKEMEYIERF